MIWEFYFIVLDPPPHGWPWEFTCLVSGYVPCFKNVGISHCLSSLFSYCYYGFVFCCYLFFFNYWKLGSYTKVDNTPSPTNNIVNIKVVKTLVYLSLNMPPPYSREDSHSWIACFLPYMYIHSTYIYIPNHILYCLIIFTFQYLYILWEFQLSLLFTQLFYFKIHV